MIPLTLQRTAKGTPSGTYGYVTAPTGKLVVPFTLEPILPVDAGHYLYPLVCSHEFSMAVFRGSNIPGHTEVEFHRGNRVSDTRDCQLCGMTKGDVYDSLTGHLLGLGILESAVALTALMTYCGVPNYLQLQTDDAVARFIGNTPDLFTIDLTISDPVEQDA